MKNLLNFFVVRKENVNFADRKMKRFYFNF